MTKAKRSVMDMLPTEDGFDPGFSRKFAQQVEGIQADLGRADEFESTFFGVRQFECLPVELGTADARAGSAIPVFAALGGD